MSCRGQDLQPSSWPENGYGEFFWRFLCHFSERAQVAAVISLRGQGYLIAPAHAHSGFDSTPYKSTSTLSLKGT